MIAPYFVYPALSAAACWLWPLPVPAAVCAGGTSVTVSDELLYMPNPNS